MLYFEKLQKLCARVYLQVMIILIKSVRLRVKCYLHQTKYDQSHQLISLSRL